MTTLIYFHEEASFTKALCEIQKLGSFVSSFDPFFIECLLTKEEAGEVVGEEGRIIDLQEEILEEDFLSSLSYSSMLILASYRENFRKTAQKEVDSEGVSWDAPGFQAPTCPKSEE